MVVILVVMDRIPIRCGYRRHCTCGGLMIDISLTTVLKIIDIAASNYSMIRCIGGISGSGRNHIAKLVAK